MCVWAGSLCRRIDSALGGAQRPHPLNSTSPFENGNFDRNEGVPEPHLIKGESFMSQSWDPQEFLERFQDGEFYGQLVDAIGQLSPEQLRDLERFMARHGDVVEDLKRSG